MTDSGAPSLRVLGDLGERRIIAEMIKPTFTTGPTVVRGIGDDVAALRVTPGYELLVTTDPCPVPVISLLGDEDRWHWGRLTVVICLSDLAASGATPLGMVVSSIMPEDMDAKEYQRYLDSLEHFADRWHCPVVGGNIKDGIEFSACATAFGEAPRGRAFTRRGVRTGDAVCVIGNIGHFWSAVLAELRGWEDLDAKYGDIFRLALGEPTPRLPEGLTLAAAGGVHACVDASDGLGAALEILAQSNELDIVLDQALLPIDGCVREVASRATLHPLALALSWGDWQLVFTAAPERAADLVAMIRDMDAPCEILGYAGQPSSGRLCVAGESDPVAIRSFASERFSSGSYFSHGLESYVELMRLGPFRGD